MMGVFIAAAAIWGRFWRGKNFGIPPITTIETETLAPELFSKHPAEAHPEISLSNLSNNQAIASGFTVQGKVKGNWFFEGSFPVEILNANRQKLSTVLAQTKEDWMTSEMIGFFAKLDFPKPLTDHGYVVFRRDNPSGLPEHDREFTVQVRFSGQDRSSRSGSCVIGGCSGQLCIEASQAEAGGITSCEMRPEYECYQNFGQCRRQANGLCGWTPTKELQSCLAKY